MQNNYENKAFLVKQIEAFLDRFPIGVINKDKLMNLDVDVVLETYIILLRDSISELREYKV